MADDKIYANDERNHRRMVNAVRRVEGMPTGGGGGHGAGGGFGPMGFWAKIKSRKPNDHRYGWEMVMATDPDDALYPDQMVEHSDHTLDSAAFDDSDDRYAVEVYYRSAYVPIGSIVWMWPAYGQPYYLFEYLTAFRFFKVGGTEISGATLTGTISITNGNAFLYKLNGPTGLIPDSDDTATMKIHNSTETAVAADAIVQCKMIEGKWFVDVESCSAS